MFLEKWHFLKERRLKWKFSVAKLENQEPEFDEFPEFQRLFN